MTVEINVSDASATATTNAPPRVEALGISKSFAGVPALENVSLVIEPGTFHALLGENGAGKSTLVKCMMGFYQADAGVLKVNGSPIKLKSPRDAQSHAIGMVYQHFTLVDSMSVAENLLIARRHIPALIRWQQELPKLEAFMRTVPFALDPKRLVRDLASGEKQKLELLKQLYLGSRLIILDEPTSVLTPDEADEILGHLRLMTQQGELSVLIITHKFREVLAFADSVTVLRRGRCVGTERVKDSTPERMAEMMVGSEPPKVAATRGDREAGDVVLQILDLEADNDIANPALRGVRLSVRSGEILGIAGVSGNGQEELVEVLAGQRSVRSGSVQVAGQAYGATRAEIRAQRVRLLPEAPLRNACVAEMALEDNLAFRDFDQAPFARGGLLWRGPLRERAQKAIQLFQIKTPSSVTPIGRLSGGNVQRAVLSRELAGDVSLLVAANPCFGLDFAATAEIRTRLLEARRTGTAVLLISTDLDELFALSDRIVVMSEGRIVYETLIAKAEVKEIGRHMAAHG
jgi:simple sugar transport system ATP-binding protein